MSQDQDITLYMQHLEGALKDEGLRALRGEYGKITFEMPSQQKAELDQEINKNRHLKEVLKDDMQSKTKRSR